MPDMDWVHYLMIVDRSGSMHKIATDTEGGIRDFVAKQLEGANGGKRTVSFYQFDDKHELVHDFAPLADVKGYTLSPRGWTALLDACGKAIAETGERLAGMPEDERPFRVMAVIATDGQENSSQEYTRERVREMITHQQDRYAWRFTYIGANQDSFAEAGSLGIRRDATLNYTATVRGTSNAWLSAGRAVSCSTAPTSVNITYTTDERSGSMSK